MLPDLTDEWVDEATEFDTVAELRADVRRRSETSAGVQAQMASRQGVLEEAAELVTVMPPETLVETEVRNRINDLAERLAEQRVSLEQYLGATGQDPDAFLEGVREGARKGVLADLALRAVAVDGKLEASDDDLEAELARLAERMGQKVEKARRDLDRGGLVEAVRSDLARGKALQFLVDHAEVVDEEGNALDLTLDADALWAYGRHRRSQRYPRQRRHRRHRRQRTRNSYALTRQKEHRADVHALRHREHQPGARVINDIWSRLLKDRIVFLGTPINDVVANLIVGAAAAPRERRPRQRHHASTSTRPAATSRDCSRSTTRCSTSRPTCRPSASVRPRRPPP